MARKGFVTVALPDELMEEIDQVVAKRKQGYTSRPEIIKEAVRRLLKELK